VLNNICKLAWMHRHSDGKVVSGMIIKIMRG
jgi:hypothetical protein